LTIFNRNLLRQHAITGNKIAFRHKASPQFRFSRAVDLHDVQHGAKRYTVAVPAHASDRIEISSRTILMQLVCGEVVRKALRATALRARLEVGIPYGQSDADYEASDHHNKKGLHAAHRISRL